MIKRFFALVPVIMIAICSLAQHNRAGYLLPKPADIKMGNINSTFTFRNDTKVVCKMEDKSIGYAIDELDRIAVEVFGKKLPKSTKIMGANNVIIRHDNSLKDEEYRLDISPENIIIY